MNVLYPHESGCDVGVDQGKDPLAWAEMNCCCSVGSTPTPLSWPAHPQGRSAYQVARKWPEKRHSLLHISMKQDLGTFHFSQEIKAQSKAPFGTHLTSGPASLIYCLWGLGTLIQLTKPQITHL